MLPLGGTHRCILATTWEPEYALHGVGRDWDTPGPTDVEHHVIGVYPAHQEA